MTTAAPPEKMMEADWRALKKYGSHFKSCPAFADDDRTCNCGYRDALSEAARRLSAPATLPREPTEAMFIAAREWSRKYVGSPIGNRAATGCWQSMWDAAPQSAPAPAAPRVGDDAKHETWCASLATTRLTKQPYECNCLSAPPAASADAREPYTTEHLIAWLENALTTRTWYSGEHGRLQAIIALLRKRAAQGVDDEIEQTLRDAVQAAILQLEYLNESQSRGTTESTLARLRHALSALPKGQEHG